MIGVKVAGLDLAKQTLNHAADGLSDRRALFNELGRIGVDGTVQHFHDQRDPDGIPWAPLQPETIERKQGRTDRLMNKLDLINSITFAPLDNGVFIHSSLSNERVAPHQYGNPSRNLPKRAIFGASSEDISKLQDAAIEWLEGLF